MARRGLETLLLVAVFTIQCNGVSSRGVRREVTSASQALATASVASSSLRGGGNGASSSDLVALFTQEVQKLAEEIDNEKIECAASDAYSKKLTAELGAGLNRASQKTAKVETTISKFTGQIGNLKLAITKLQEQLTQSRTSCTAVRTGLAQQEKAAQAGQQSAQRLIVQMVTACQNSQVLLDCGDDGRGGTRFEVNHPSLRLAAKRLETSLLGERGNRSLVSQSRGCRLTKATADLQRDMVYPSGIVGDPKLLTSDAYKAEPDPASLTKDGEPKPNGAADTAKPSCAQVIDSSDDMVNMATLKVTAASAAIAAHDQKCSAKESLLNTELRQKVKELAQAQELRSNALEQKGQMINQRNQITSEIEAHQTRSAKKAADCKDSLQQLEGELSDSAATRRLLLVNAYGSKVKGAIQDCQVSEWTAGVCSQKCTSANGTAGVQLLTRSVVLQPDTSTLEGRYGAPCPPLNRTVECGVVPCPVDCEMGQWSAWSDCSKNCGGGEQYRVRSTTRNGMYGGKVCGQPSERRACNAEACHQDCKLDDWSAWSPCSRRCKWKAVSTPGHAQRSRAVLEEAFGRGTCLAEKDREQFRECNAYLCPTSLSELRCTADQDIVFLLDGSGSVQSAARFQHQKDLFQAFLKNSDLTGEAAGSLNNDAAKGVRYGVVLFGDKKTRIITPLSGQQSALSAAVSGLTWPQGATTLAEGLAVVPTLLELSQRRHATAVIFSDGSFRDLEASVEAAQRLKNDGVRVMVLLAQPLIAPGAKVDEKHVCRVASSPCVDHVLRVRSFDRLTADVGRFLSAVCPVGFSAAP